MKGNRAGKSTDFVTLLSLERPKSNNQGNNFMQRHKEKVPHFRCDTLPEGRLRNSFSLLQLRAYSQTFYAVILTANKPGVRLHQRSDSSAQPSGSSADHRRAYQATEVASARVPATRTSGSGDALQL